MPKPKCLQQSGNPEGFNFGIGLVAMLGKWSSKHFHTITHILHLEDIINSFKMPLCIYKVSVTLFFSKMTQLELSKVSHLA